jgi:hypothetical protein
MTRTFEVSRSVGLSGSRVGPGPTERRSGSSGTVGPVPKGTHSLGPTHSDLRRHSKTPVGPRVIPTCPGRSDWVAPAAATLPWLHGRLLHGSVIVVVPRLPPACQEML